MLTESIRNFPRESSAAILETESEESGETDGWAGGGTGARAARAG